MKSQPAIVTLSVEVNENIYNCMQDFLASNPQWDQKKLINASISSFLMQNHTQMTPKAYQDCSKIYLRSISTASEHYSLN